MRTNNAILEFAYHYQGPYYVSVTTSVYEKSISAFKTMWEYYSKDYYKMLKGIKWDIYPDRRQGISKQLWRLRPVCQCGLQIQLLQDMQKFTDIDVGPMWRQVIRPTLAILTRRDIPLAIPSNHKLDGLTTWLKRCLTVLRRRLSTTKCLIHR